MNQADFHSNMMIRFHSILPRFLILFYSGVRYYPLDKEADICWPNSIGWGVCAPNLQGRYNQPIIGRFHTMTVFSLSHYWGRCQKRMINFWSISQIRECRWRSPTWWPVVVSTKWSLSCLLILIFKISEGSVGVARVTPKMITFSRWLGSTLDKRSLLPSRAQPTIQLFSLVLPDGCHLSTE